MRNPLERLITPTRSPTCVEWEKREEKRRIGRGRVYTGKKGREGMKEGKREERRTGRWEGGGWGRDGGSSVTGLVIRWHTVEKMVLPSVCQDSCHSFVWSLTHCIWWSYHSSSMFQTSCLSWWMEILIPQDWLKKKKRRIIASQMCGYHFKPMAYLWVVTPNSIEPDHLNFISEISTSNNSLSLKGWLDMTTPWSKIDSALEGGERERERERER